jgi:hypothetical protein
MLDLPRSDKAATKNMWGNVIYLDWGNAQIYPLTRCTMTVHVIWSFQLSEMWCRYYMAMENDISHDETKPAAIKWGIYNFEHIWPSFCIYFQLNYWKVLLMLVELITITV